MRKFAALMAIGCVIFTMTGCQSTEFGMPESQFNQLSDAQKQTVMQNYYQQQQLQQVNEAISTVGDVITSVKSTPSG